MEKPLERVIFGMGQGKKEKKNIKGNFPLWGKACGKQDSKTIWDIHEAADLLPGKLMLCSSI